MEIVLSHHHTIAAILAQLPTVIARVRLAVVCRAWAVAMRESPEIWRDLDHGVKTLRLRRMVPLGLARFRKAAVLLNAPRDVWMLEHVCLRGKFDIADWLVAKHDFTIDDLARKADPLKIPLLRQMRGRRLRLEGVRWAICRFGITRAQLLASECLYPPEGAGSRLVDVKKHLAALEWLIEHYSLSRQDLAEWAEDTFGLACEQGEQHLLRWIADRQLVPPNANPRGLMVDACHNGHTEVAKFLTTTLNITSQMMTAWNWRPFHEACRFGNFDTAQWLAESYAIPKDVIVHMQYGHSIVTIVCQAGGLLLVQWLVTHYRLSREEMIAANIQEVLITNAQRDQRNSVTMWLLSAFDLREYRHATRALALSAGNTALVEWLDTNND